jgi:FkbM family methyltransferase
LEGGVVYGLRVSLRILIGKRRRNLVMSILNLDYRRAEGIRYLCLTSYEPYIHRVVRKVLENPGTQTFIDIGAHIGIYTLYAHRLMSRKPECFRIVAVEPHPHSYSILERKIMGLTSVDLVKEAVYVKDGETIFHLGSLHRSSSVTPTEHHVKGGLVSGEAIYVKSVRIDSLIRRLGLERVDLLKMDIEGAEYIILTDPTLDLSVVENMIVEVHYNYRSKESRDIMRALVQKGFKIAPLYPDNTSWAYHLVAFRGNVPW